MSKKLGKLFQNLMTVAVALAMVLCIIAPADAQAAAKSPALNATSKTIVVGKSFDFNIKNKIAGATYEWSVSNKNVLTVNKVGLVTGVGVGKSNVTCKINVNGGVYRLTARVTVLKPAVKVTITNPIDTLKVKDFYQLEAKILPASSNDYLTWKSSDSSIAKVDQKGEVFVQKEGIVTITATSLSGRSDSVTLYIGAAALQNKPTEVVKEENTKTTPSKSLVVDTVLYKNDFSSSLDGYYNFGPSVLNLNADDIGSDGEKGYMEVTGRTSTWNGAAVDLISKVAFGETYTITAFVKYDKGDDTESIRITHLNCIDGTDGYNSVTGETQIKKGEWTEITGTFQVDPKTSKCQVYFEAGSLIDFYVDNVVIDLAK